MSNKYKKRALWKSKLIPALVITLFFTPLLFLHPSGHLGTFTMPKSHSVPTIAYNIQTVKYTPPVVIAPPQPVQEPSNWYKAWIYNEESGNNPTRWNTSGCLGLGQACPASKLLAVCPNEDYACEDEWFTNYMLARYGTWEQAYYFHLANGWW